MACYDTYFAGTAGMSGNAILENLQPSLRDSCHLNSINS
jgi:hypothetical protein